MLNNFVCFPITKYGYRKGLDRCYEPFNVDEKNECFGPSDRPCIECYLPLLPVFVVMDIVTFCCIPCDNKPITNSTDNSNN